MPGLISTLRRIALCTLILLGGLAIRANANADEPDVFTVYLALKAV